MVNAALSVVVQLTELLIDLVGNKQGAQDTCARWVSEGGGDGSQGGIAGDRVHLFCWEEL